MLTLKLLDEKCRAENELGGYIKEHSHLLEEALGKEEAYEDSLGWLCTSEWAGEEMLARFEALAKEKVNVKMIDQGSSELNIIIGIEDRDFNTAIKAIYRAFVENK